ncbi:MAG TPA: hypothetical protein VGG14_20480, partial [Candidatus Sulfotelmatobacter sp.]
MSRLVRISLCVAAALAFAVCEFASAQAPVPSSPQVDQRVDAILHKMTLEQKLDYIGGTGFGVRAIASLNIP